MNNWEINKEVKFIEKDKKSTEVRKNKFIQEIKNGLGDEIKNKLTPLPKGKNKGNFITRFFKRLFL